MSIEKEVKDNYGIFEYIRRRKGGRVAKVGIIYGTVVEGTIKIGWSKCNIKEKDRFDITIGLQMALDRAMRGNSEVPTPNCIRKQLRNFGARTIRYFKDAKTLVMPN